MPHYSFSQSQDSLPIKELNKEFLKGIEAREKLHTLKQVLKLDSIQLSLYKDSIVPSLQEGVIKSKNEIIRLEDKVEKQKSQLTIFKYISAILAGTLTLFILIK